MSYDYLDHPWQFRAGMLERNKNRQDRMAELTERIARNLYRREIFLRTGRTDADLLTECVHSTQETYHRWARFLLGEEVGYAPIPAARVTR